MAYWWFNLWLKGSIISLYKLPLNQGNGNGSLVSLTVDYTATKPVCNDLSFTEGSVCEKMVTTISYISIVWLKFVSSLKLHDRRKEEVFHVMIGNHWFLNVGREFIEHRLGNRKKMILESHVVTNMNHQICLHHLCCCFHVLYIHLKGQANIR